MTQHLQNALDNFITLVAQQIADQCAKEFDRLSAQQKLHVRNINTPLQDAPVRPKAENTLLKIRQVQERTALSRSSIYAMIKLGEFPKAIKIGERAVAWSEAAITQWIAQRAA